MTMTATRCARRDAALVVGGSWDLAKQKVVMRRRNRRAVRRAVRQALRAGKDVGAIERRVTGRDVS